VISGKTPAKSTKTSSSVVAILIAQDLTQELLSRALSALRRAGFDATTTRKLSENAYQVRLTGKTALSHHVVARQISIELGLDVILQTEELYLTPKRLIAFDMDSTLITCEVIDELARENGVYDEVAAITESAMKGNLDFSQSLAQRCMKLKGLSTDAMNRVAARIQLTAGAKELIRELKAQGYKTALLSGGFAFFAVRIQRELALDYAYANTLEFENGALTGRVIPPVVSAERKAALLEEIASLEGIPLSQVVAVGDGANDLLMLAKAGLGVAFNARPAVRDQASASLNQKSLLPILWLLHNQLG
jgi:phosphoserine phosphatase